MSVVAVVLRVQLAACTVSLRASVLSVLLESVLQQAGGVVKSGYFGAATLQLLAVMKIER